MFQNYVESLRSFKDKYVVIQPCSRSPQKYLCSVPIDFEEENILTEGRQKESGFEATNSDDSLVRAAMVPNTRKV